MVINRIGTIFEWIYKKGETKETSTFETYIKDIKVVFQDCIKQ